MKTPATIPDCLELLDAVVDEDYKSELKNRDPSDLTEFNEDLGQYIRNSWLYDESSPLVKTFRLMELNWTSLEEVSAYLIKFYREYLLGSDYDQNKFMEGFRKEVNR